VKSILGGIAFFMVVNERPQEAPFMTYKKAIATKILKRIVGIAPENYL
jgi:hypothetical protein